MKTFLRRVPRLALGAGALVFWLGLWAAMTTLPEWRARGERDPELMALVRRRLEGIGGKVSGLRFRTSTSDSEKAVEAAYRLLGTRGREWLLSSGTAAGRRVIGTLQVPGVAAGPFEIETGSDGSLRSFAWLPGGSLITFTGSPPGSGRERDAFLDRVAALMAAGSPLDAARTSEITMGGAAYRVTPIRGTSPQEVIHRAGPPSPIAVLSRNLDDPDAARRLSTAAIYRNLLYRGGPAILLAGTVLVLFVIRLLRSRVSLRIGALLTGVAALSMLAGATLPSEVSGGTMGLVLGLLVRLVLLVFLLVLWATAESLLRDTVPGFTTSLDAFAAGRLTPRGGRAVIAGLGLGAAIAGLKLGALSLAAARLAPQVRPTELSFEVPLLDGTRSPFFEGPFLAATLVFAIACLRFVLPRGVAESVAALLVGLLVSFASPIAPWGAGFALSLAVAIVALVSFRWFGLASLLVAAISAPLLRDLPASLRLASVAPLPFLFCTVGFGAIVVVGFLALSRHEREDEGRIDAPEYIRRVESERRVKYEMDLLSRMQLAMLPDHPPAVPGLEMSVRTVLATEAGGDLYEFIEEADPSARGAGGAELPIARGVPQRDGPGDDGEGAPSSGGAEPPPCKILWVAAGDVSGHGYSCGIQGAMVKAALLSLAKDGRRPAEVLCEIDRVLRAAKAGRLFTSLALLKLDTRTGKGVLANAGHPFPLLVADGRCREVTGSGLPLGQGPARSYEEREVEIPEGGSLVFASDGLFEGPNRFDEPYGYERPRAVLESVGLWRRPAEAIVEALFADWRDHVGEGAPADDTTVLVVKRPALAW